MAREAKSIPDHVKEKGVQYVVDIDDGHVVWGEYRDLKDKAERSAEEETRLLELEPKIDDLVILRIGPYSHDEFKRIESSVNAKAFSFKVDSKQRTEVTGDIVGASEKIQNQVCAERIYEVVSEYTAVEAVVDSQGEHQHDGAGEPMYKRSRLRTGKELVEFITKKAWDTQEYLILEDAFKAIRVRSHLEKGQKKTWPKPQGS